jgi:TonB family protein
VTDPVSEELARRSQMPWPWRSSLAVALAAHLALVATVLLAPAGPRTRLILPSVRVKLGVTLPAAPKAVAPAPGSEKPAPHPAPPARPKPRQQPRESRKPLRSPAKAAPAAVAPARTREAPAAPTTDEEEPGPTPATATGGAARSGGIAVGGAGPTDEAFPYGYYLNRLLGMIESNWFRPPVPPGTTCRVLCRIDRTGRLIEAGVEESSGVPSFDRAALRAVYASAPFPPLPQGFGGAMLTLHLEFGQ